MIHEYIEIVWPNIKCPVCLKSLKTTQSLYQIWSETFHFVFILGIKKPYKDKSGKAFEEDRLVAAQPLMFGSTFNVRKLNNLPYHRIKADQIEALKTECLYNFKFIFCKLLATSCRYMFQIFLFPLTVLLSINIVRLWKFLSRSLLRKSRTQNCKPNIVILKFLFTKGWFRNDLQHKISTNNQLFLFIVHETISWFATMNSCEWGSPWILYMYLWHANTVM